MKPYYTVYGIAQEMKVSPELVRRAIRRLPLRTKHAAGFPRPWIFNVYEACLVVDELRILQGRKKRKR